MPAKYNRLKVETDRWGNYQLKMPYLNSTNKKDKQVLRLLLSNKFEYWGSPTNAWIGRLTPENETVLQEIDNLLTAEYESRPVKF